MNELRGMRKEAVVAKFAVEGLRKNTKHFSQNIRPPYRDLNLGTRANENGGVH
jgi:hypothetical protein